jgi:L-malate glycosyltransferase
MPLRILHCHSTFDLGGKEARSVRLMNAFGDAARHTIISAMPGALAARAAIAADIRASFPERHPSLTGRPTLARFRALAEFMRDFDLILTYNWGAMDAVMARRIFAKDLPPLVHHEDGFNADEAAQLKTERNLFRRLGLPAAHALVVPSQRLEAIALDVWKQPRTRVVRIANGIDTAAYAGKPTRAIPGFKKVRGEVVIGTLAGLRAVKNLPMLVRAVAAVPGVRLVIVGEGPEREAIMAEADRIGMADRLVLPGFLPTPHRYIGHFDIFALSSLSEQFPISLAEAMAGGLPAVATDVGDVRAIVAPENLPFIVRDEAAMAQALRALAGSPGLRRQVGAANRAKARATLDERLMIDRYRAVYGLEDLTSGH